MDVALKHVRRKRLHHSAGFSMVETLVSSTLLMLAVTQSLSLFGTTMDSLGKSQLRDSLNAFIHADLERVRNSISTWELDNSIDGITSYSPDQQACQTNSLADKLLTEKRSLSPAELEASTTLDLSNTTIPLRGSTITRTINTFSRDVSQLGDSNLIDIQYTTSATSLIRIERRAVLSIPAQGWCQYDQVSSS